MSRYERQELLAAVGVEGQKRLRESVVAIVGLGALGSVSSSILARAGVGKLLLLDYDIVQLSNLQRQLYDEADVGKAKVHAAAAHVKKMNSEITCVPFLKQLSATTVDLLAEADVVLDCTDNMHTRFLLNEYCMKEGKVMIYCGAVEDRGAVYVVDSHSKRACFSCVFSGRKGLESCDDAGILASASHAAASVQCSEALAVLLGKKHTEALISFSLWPLSFSTVKVKKREECAVCNGNYSLLLGKGETTFCLTKRCVKVLPREERKIVLKRPLAQYDGAAAVEIDGVKVLVYEGGALEIATTDLDKAHAIAQQLYN